MQTRIQVESNLHFSAANKDFTYILFIDVELGCFGINKFIIA